jgi:hypothetical protein
MTHTSTRTPPPDPFEVWPKPVGSWSSIHAAAEALWKHAEVRYYEAGSGPDPVYILEGAMATALDALEEVRVANRLSPNSTIQDVLPFLTPRVIRDGEPRLTYIHRLLTYAIENDIESRVKNGLGLS